METSERHNVPRVKGQFDGDEERKKHGITVSDTAWDGLERLAQQFGMKSRSDVIDAIGRSELIRIEEMEAAIASILQQIPEQERTVAQQHIERILQSLKS